MAGGSWDLLQLQSMQESTPADSAEAPLFAPVARIPFQEEPLPQPSQPLPALVDPLGEVMAFTPSPTASEATIYKASASSEPPASQDLQFADYPTNVHMPVPTTPPSLPSAAPAPVVPQATQVPMRYPGADMLNYPVETNLSRTTGMLAGSVSYWENDERYAAPQSQPLNPSRPLGNIYHGPAENVFKNGWGQEEEYTPFSPLQKENAPGPGDNNGWGDLVDPISARQTLPVGLPAANIYPGLVQKPLDINFSSSHLDRPSVEANKYVQPLPIWISALSIVLGALLLVGLVFLYPDWATGALIAGVIAIILAILLLIANGVRVALGMLEATNPRRRSQVISTLLLVLVLFVFSGAGLTQQSGLHAMQARYLEQQHSWQSAINEFEASGESAPASINLARVYDEWGEALSKQQQYASAVARFHTILTTYKGASSLTPKTQADMVAAYQNWGKSSALHKDYATSVSAYDTLLTLTYCTATCQSQAQTNDATAYYNLAEQLLNQMQYTGSVNAFNVLTSRFSSAPEVKQSHGDYAKALWRMAEQQLKTTCSDAVKTYQQLARQFADTNLGKQAAMALPKAVSVKGHFTTTIPPAPSTPTVALVQNMYTGISDSQFAQLLRNAPVASVQKDGTFLFPSVPQGTYELVWSYDGNLNYYYAHNGNQILYKVKLGPLCAYNYGDINQTISPPAVN